MDCLPRLSSSIYSWYLIAIWLNRNYHLRNRVNLEAMVIKGLLNAPQNFETPESESYKVFLSCSYIEFIRTHCLNDSDYPG